MRILGVTSSSIELSAYELISTIIVDSAQSSVLFSGLDAYSSTYKHLQIRATARSLSSASWADTLNVRFNGDSGSNYSAHVLFGTGAAVEAGSSISATSAGLILMRGFGLSENSSVFASAVIDIVDSFSTTKNKTLRASSGAITGVSAQNQVRLTSGLYRSTAAITSIDLQPASAANLAVGSRFSLYGIKG
jgi:hypothetical protein